jgi:hypothetical protein
MKVALAAMIAAGLAWRGARKRSLTPSGAAAAFAVGFLSFVSSTRSGILLIAVSDRRFLVGSRVPHMFS